jgi:hypothetical protein
MSDRVVELTAEDLDWSFRDSRPRLRTGRGSSYEVDPFPAYPHDLDLVRATLEQVERAVSIEHKPTLYVFHFEPIARTNGWAERGYGRYDREAERHTLAPGQIVLAGKRIPPHPAMTRYLVAHEYGHHVDYTICDRRGLEVDGLDEEYAKLRRLPAAYDRYGGGRWHSNVGELIANDFRILVAGVEPEFWPHPGYARPEAVDGLADWWKAALDV